MAYLPFEYIHAPIPNRKHYQKGLSSIQTRANDLIIRLLALRYKNNILSPSHAEEGLVDMGKYFRSLSLLTRKEFQGIVRETNVSFLNSYIRFLEHNLAKIDDPPEWVYTAYKQHFEALREYILSPRVLEISDLAVDPSKQFIHMQSLLKTYGRLLILWPALHSLCRQANAEGLRMGRRI